jgi:hypothetical protein
MKKYILFILLILDWGYSLSKGKLAVPAVWDAKKATITGDALMLQKSKLESLYQKLA